MGGTSFFCDVAGGRLAGLAKAGGGGLAAEVAAGDVVDAGDVADAADVGASAARACIPAALAKLRAEKSKTLRKLGPSAKRDGVCIKNPCKGGRDVRGNGSATHAPGV